MKIINLVKNLEQIFGGTQQAWWVIEKITGKTEADLVAHENLELTKEQQDKLNLFIEKAKQHYPLQYLLESVPFLDLDILVKPPVLIPRPETEEWVGDLIDSLEKYKKSSFKILDLCSGSGCIALALAKNFPNSFVYGIDISQNCIDLANKNKILNKISNAEFILSDLYQNLNPTTPLPPSPRFWWTGDTSLGHARRSFSEAWGRAGEKNNFQTNLNQNINSRLQQDFVENGFDLIVANPPYISEKDFKNLQPEVKNWEDKRALVAENNGLEIIEKIIKQAKNYLNPESSIKKAGLNQIYIEIGYDQAQEVSKLFQNNNFSNITIIKDLNKRDRVVSAGV